MPPKKAVKKETPPPKPDLESSDEEISVQEDSPKVTKSKPTVTVKYNSNDNDRVQLAQAINNLTVKGEQFMEAFSSFSKFRETVAQLDIEIESKKKEYKELCQNTEKEYKEKTHTLQKEYEEKNKNLSNSYSDSNRELQNDYKNKQIEVTQKLKEFKLKGCNDMAKEFDMTVLKTEEVKNLNDTISKTQKELEELKKKFDSECAKVRGEERGRFEAELKRQKTEQELTYKTNTAEMKAQLDQQKREVQLLTNTIETLKAEIAEQRNLTIEIAQANSKGQITQNIGGKSN
jgi:Skp family chaperone for outer membrane proteins